jgi:sulfite reductase (NADPH) flavoprotein alpha-component
MPNAFQPPLPEEKASQLARLAEGLDAPALQWISGYLAGLAAQLGGEPARPQAAAPAPAAEPRNRLTVLYGSQTGNAKRLAETLARRAEAAGLPVRLLRADAYPQRELKDERLLYLVISTQGDGDPPDDARGLVEFLASRRAPRLGALKYAVLGLGDSSYPQFCAVARRLDERLAELGGKPLFGRGEADLDLDSVARPWLEQALGQAREALARTGGATLATVTPLRAARPAWSREHPFAAEVLANQRITGRGSERHVRHLELSLEGSGLNYQPGDALGVWPRQAPALVEAVLAAFGLDGDTPVERDGERLPLATWLGERRELTRLTRPFLAAHAERSGAAELHAALAPEGRDRLARLLADWQLLDLARAHPAAWDAEALVAALRPLTPRLYSIASSPKAVGEEAHLTVADIDYRRDGEPRWGTASRYLVEREEGEAVPVFVEANERFRLPADPGRDIVMIGPGTGVAPFRAFVQERAAIGAGGRNWLLFGNPHFRTDFLYQLEWQQALKQGTLHRLDLAFSRDQAGKVYVQQRLRERGRELYDWLQQGAHLYVCGDAARMAPDVHAALRYVAAEHGGLDGAAAENWLGQLIQQGRYVRDVY